MSNDETSTAYPPEVKALHAALAKAQGEFPAIGRERTVTVETKTGGRYSFAYAPLDVILAAIRPVLAANGLALVQRLESPGGAGPAIRTELRHAEGGVLAASFPLGELPSSPQALGSLLTYHRRYALVSMLAIAAEDDDDGNRAAGNRASAVDSPRSKDPALTPDDETGETGEASPFIQPEFPVEGEPLTAPQRRKVFAIRTKLIDAGVLTDDVFRAQLAEAYGVDSVSGLTKGQASNLIENLIRKENELGA